MCHFARSFPPALDQGAGGHGQLSVVESSTSYAHRATPHTYGPQSLTSTRISVSYRSAPMVHRSCR
jgi:hypothetical protein